MVNLGLDQSIMEFKTAFDFDFKAKTSKGESIVYLSHIDYNGSVLACAGNGFIKLYDVNAGQVNSSFWNWTKSIKSSDIL